MDDIDAQLYARLDDISNAVRMQKSAILQKYKLEGRFVMLLQSKQGMKAMLSLMSAKQYGAISVLIYLLYNAGYCNKLNIKQSAIADAIGISRATVNKALRVLESMNIIQSKYETGKRTKTYYMNRDFAWKGKAEEQYKCDAYGAVKQYEEVL